MAQTVTDIGEFGLIRRIDTLLRAEGVTRPGVDVSIGDDCACVRPGPGRELLVTCDCMVEGRHYLPRHMSPVELGRRAMVMNISDIGAMGGTPSWALVSLGLTGTTGVDYIEDLYRGFCAELNPFGAVIVGGNLTGTEHGMFIDITLFGEAEPDTILRRSTARPGDVLLVTGYPGQAAAGLEILTSSQDPGSLQEHPLVRAYRTPGHRAREGRAVARTGLASAMIDISDGFPGDLNHICEESKVGARISRDRLPISDALATFAAESDRDPRDLVLRDSDDYELLVTCAPDTVGEIRSAVAGVGDCPLTEVGLITGRDDGLVLALPDGLERILGSGGWDHFAS